MAEGTTRRRRSREQWRVLIEQAQASGLGAAAFCAQHGVSTTRFYQWRRRLSPSPGDEAAAAGPFLDLGRLAGAPGAPGGWEVELDLGAGLVLRLRRG